MCGIAGWFATGAEEGRHDRDLLDRMTATLGHRGPDAHGVWLDPESGVGLGARRLAIVDLSAKGHQPMASADGRYVVAFNGEIYNFRDLQRSLKGYPFRGHSDTEVLLAAVLRWGVEGALRRFNGMFAFALWDRAERTLTLARDPMGEKPLYYGWMGSTLLFGSELKALRAHPRFDGEVDRDALALFLRHKYVPAPWSIYRRVKKLPAGSTLAIRTGRSGPGIRFERYWDPADVADRAAASPLEASPEEATDELDALLLDAVGLRMHADVPLGAFLSGGVDSSTVVAMMQAQSSQPVRTFTIGFQELDFNEAPFAKDVAAHLGTDHTELYVSPREAMEVIPRLPVLYDEPFADSSQIPTFLISQLARRRVTVALSGDGGDELFGGYNRYLWGGGVVQRMAAAPRFVRRMAAGALGGASPAAWDRMFRALRPVLPPALRQPGAGDKMQKLSAVLAAQGPPASLYLDMISHWKDPAGLVLGAAEPATAASDPARWPSAGGLAAQMMFVDAITYLPDDILAKVDRASMGTSLEARVPILDPRVVEFAWRLPLEMKVRGRRGKWLLRRVLHRYVPDALIERPKAGFGVPIGDWLRGPLRGWAEELLAADRLRAEGYLDPEPIRARWTEHLSGRRNWQYPLWDVLMFESWLEAVSAETRQPSAGRRAG